MEHGEAMLPDVAGGSVLNPPRDGRGGLHFSGDQHHLIGQFDPKSLFPLLKYQHKREFQRKVPPQAG